MGDAPITGTAPGAKTNRDFDRIELTGRVHAGSIVFTQCRDNEFPKEGQFWRS